MNAYQLKQTAFREHLERERQKWLAAGMSEADIFCIHFGGDDENGHGGDYGAWLAERAQIRGDHQFAPGVPQSLESVKYESLELADARATNEIISVELEADIIAAIKALPAAQAKIAEAIYKEGINPAQYAGRTGMSKANAYRLWEKARTKLKELLAGTNFA
jgi:hypothetical protein